MAYHPSRYQLLVTDGSPDATRRDLIKKTGVALVSITLGLSLLQSPKPVLADVQSQRTSQKTVGKLFAMAIDIKKCIACDACTVSCKAENSVPMGVFRTWVEKHEAGSYPNLKLIFAPKLCNQCDNPPCVDVCPVDATFKRADGLVLVDYDKCIGCGYCITACPYGARYFDTRRNVVDKCTFCVQRLEQGLDPACVETCVGGARIFGDLNDPDSALRKIVDSQPVQVLKPQLGTKPQVFYVGLDTTVVK